VIHFSWYTITHIDIHQNTNKISLRVITEILPG